MSLRRGTCESGQKAFGHSVALRLRVFLCVAAVFAAAVAVVAVVATWISVLDALLALSLAASHCTTHYFMAYHMCTL